MSFVNKVVLVVGGSSGIGASTAIEFSKEGADVAIVGRKADKLQKVAEGCRKNGKEPLIIKADISNDKEAAKAVEDTINKYGKIDILINNAGIVRFGSILDGNLMKAYDEIVSTNLRAVMNVTRIAAPYIIKTKGNILNISSIAGQAVPKVPVVIPYSVSKAGLDQFTRGAAVELSPYGVRVNAISPGPVKTDIMENAGVPLEALESMKLDQMKTALNRLSSPVEVANMILYLTSDKCIGVTGSNFVLDNGMLLA